MKTILAILILLFLSVHENIFSEDIKWAADAEGNAPYIFQDPRIPSKNIGFEIDIVKALCEEIKMNPVFVQNQWDGLIPGLYRGDYDIAVNGIEITEDRKQSVLFSEPYYITYLQLVVKSSEKKITSLKDLKGKTAGALKNSLAERILNDFGGITVLTYEGEVNAFEDMKNGRISAALVDAPIAIYYAGWNPYLKLTGKPIGEAMYGMAIRKSDLQLKITIDKGLAKLKESGKLRNILDKWNLWNDQMGLSLNDFSRNDSKHESYNDFVQSLNQELSFEDRIFRYFSFMPRVLEAALMTIKISVLSMILAIFLGLIIAIIRVYAPAPFSTIAMVYIEVVRGTPLLIQLFIIFYALPSIGISFSPLIAAVIGLGLNYAAYEAENYRAGLFSVPRGQMEAALALGFSRRQSLRYIVIPQAVRLVIPPVTNDFISLLKDSSLVSVITLVELTKLYSQLSSTYFDYIGTGILIAVVYLLLGLPFVNLSKYMEKKYTFDNRKNK
jgi:polar amino acid transport system substrate-binding protein